MEEKKEGQQPKQRKDGQQPQQRKEGQQPQQRKDGQQPKKLPKYIDGVGWRYETEHSMLRRDRNHDYRARCIYMLTLTLSNRWQHLLGELSWKEAQSTEGTEAQSTGSTEAQSTEDAQPLLPDGTSPRRRRMPEEATFTPTALGTAVEDEWRAICRDYPQVSIIRLQLMPEHLHVIVYVHESLPKPLGQLVGTFKNRCNKHYWQELTARGLLAPKGEQKPPSLFSEGYQDSILYHEGQLEAMVKYVNENPYRALIKHENPDLFRIVREQTIGGRTFAAIGNRWLLDRAVRVQVRCHNNTSDYNLRLIERQKSYFLWRGRTEGAVVISPCISAGEKEIARAALDAGVPLVVILENGFPPMYKPPGKYFEACTKGLLLMLAPWPYHTEERKITRQQCLALNDMANALCTERWTQELEVSLMK